MPWGIWDLIPSTRDWTHVPFIRRWILNHWTTREVPRLSFNIWLSLPNSDNSRNWCHLYISEPFTDHSLTGTGNTKTSKIYSIPFFFLAEQFQRNTGKPNTKVLWWELCVWSTMGECETWEAVHLLTYKLAKGLIWYALFGSRSSCSHNLDAMFKGTLNKVSLVNFMLIPSLSMSLILQSMSASWQYQLYCCFLSVHCKEK